uniref:Uncharacterized protein n=1 Tax=Panthera leo TaxID=9689 RepID=A0A8C8XKX6_PANLE
FLDIREPWLTVSPENFSLPLVFDMEENQEECIFVGWLLSMPCPLPGFQPSPTLPQSLEGWFIATCQTHVTIVGLPVARQWLCDMIKEGTLGLLGGSVGSASDFGSGHDLTDCGFEPALGSGLTGCLEPGACFKFCVSCSLSPSPSHALSLKNKC